MKRIIVVKNGQTIFDICLQEYGSPEAVFQLITDNNLEGINANLIAGQELVITGDPFTKNVVEYYKLNNIFPASLDIDDVVEGTDAAFSEDFSLDFES